MVENVKKYFASLPDPRSELGRRHRLDEMVIIAILAVICNADNWCEVEWFAQAKEPWLRKFLELPNGIPSHDTFGRVFSALRPEAFERCFLAWTATLAKGQEKLIAIDGKTLRRSFDRASDKAAIHMVSAWAGVNDLVFGQIATEAKSNEITAIPKLLKLLEITGTTVTIDAMGCQKKIAEEIVAGGGDYVLAVKDNQRTLFEEMKLYLDDAIAGNLPEAKLAFWEEEVSKDHGRIEQRRAWSSSEIGWFADHGKWQGLRSFAVIESERCQLKTGEVSTERRYFISSLTDVEQIAHAVRQHWGIENKLHWSLDVSFNEDMSRVRIGYAAENFSRLRRMALNLLKRDKATKLGIKGKRLRAGWDENYLLKVIST